MINIKKYRELQKECEEIAIRKNTNYGSESLINYGLKGIVLRMGDKLGRLNNMVWKGQEDLNNEPIEDCFRDIINYALYGLMIQSNELESEDDRAIKFDSKLKISENMLKLNKNQKMDTKRRYFKLNIIKVGDKK